MGLTVTLHKGKNKSATDPSNYRAISLLPAVFKIFEKIVLNRFETIRPELKTNKLQYGFQRGKSCKIASFMLQESRDYCIELGTPLHACYLDSKAAFDKVWLTGLVCKLHTMGIRGKLLRIVNSTLRGTEGKFFMMVDCLNLSTSNKEPAKAVFVHCTTTLFTLTIS